VEQIFERVGEGKELYDGNDGNVSDGGAVCAR